MGMGTPSLYQYFPSKSAIYDEVFARGWRDLEAHMRAFEHAAGPVDSAEAARAPLRDGAIVFVRWALEHPVQAQLMFWRPVGRGGGIRRRLTSGERGPLEAARFQSPANR